MRQAPHIFDYVDGYIIGLYIECSECRTGFHLQVGLDQYEAWSEGTYVQEAFPDMAPGDRELFFISGVCPPCWNHMLWGISE